MKFREYLKEQRLDELSKGTLSSYIKKASVKVAHHSKAGEKVPAHDKEAKNYHKGVVKKRIKGIRKAVHKLNKPAPKPLKPKPIKKPKKKYDWAKHGVGSLVSRGISSAIKKGIVGVAKKVLT